MNRSVLALLPILVSACGGKLDTDSRPDAGRVVVVFDSHDDCAGATVPPNDLKCTGLYSDLATKTVASGVRAYAPAVPLWADNAEKSRFISLPPGTTIDDSNPNEWTFPIGTKVWKQFSKFGKRIETRLFQKIGTNDWVHATYAWNDDETAATTSMGGDIPLDGGTYHIPTYSECEQCHRGRSDYILGFEAVGLGTAGATGLTLDELASSGLISPKPANTHLQIGDDGTGAAAGPLAWLHVNCGTTCHNANENAIGYAAGMRLRLDPTLLDGRSSAAFDSLTTTLGVLAVNPSWKGRTRIVPGEAGSSLLVDLISYRGTDNPVGNQMPPIATRLVDHADVAAIVAWINKMPKRVHDAGTPPVNDASVDASVGDSAVPPIDGGHHDAGHEPPQKDASLDSSAPPTDAEVDRADADSGHHSPTKGKKP